MFCGALYFNGNKSGVYESAVKLANRACRYSHQQIEHLYHDESFALFNISRTGAEHDVLYHDAPGSLKSWYTDITGSLIDLRTKISMPAKRAKILSKKIAFISSCYIQPNRTKKVSRNFQR